MKHGNCKQISSLLILSVHGTAFLPPLLSPAGFPRVTICSYRSSFGSLGKFPFCLPLWNSGLSLSTTLLHTPTCAAKPSLLSPSCLIPPLGASPHELPQVLSGTVFASPTKSIQSDSIFSVRLDNAREQPFPCCTAKSFYQKGQENAVIGGETHTQKASPPSDLGKRCCAEVAHPTEAFSSGVYIPTKNILVAVSRWNCASH